ncbi:MAG: formylglycine-generating enzyme family protein [Rhizobiaceae bacterium]
MTRTDKGSDCCVPDRPLTKQSRSPMPHSYRQRPKPQPDEDLVALPGSEFLMGAIDGPHPEDGEGPIRATFVDTFCISKYAVTNQQYDQFVAATGYRSLAEQMEASFVFAPRDEFSSSARRPTHAPWWKLTDRAYWRCPKGKGSTIDDIANHPVVHIAQQDALAYCQWAGMRLPSEAEWEIAARGGLSQMPFPWGSELLLNGQSNCHIWSGEFPISHEYMSQPGPVAVNAYQPNGFGLYNMTGNVWERVADRFTNLHSPRPARNPRGPLNGRHYVARGGSYLCHHSYCCRYRTSSRQSLDGQATADNIGFRVAADRSS